MEEAVQLLINEKGKGAFYITGNSKNIGEMVISITGNDLTVYHTEVAAEAEGKGLAKKMLAAMVDYARSHQLKVIPLCPFVHAQFKRHPQEYADIWKQENQSV